MAGIPWSKKEIGRLKLKYPLLLIHEISKVDLVRMLPGRTIQAIIRKAEWLKIEAGTIPEIKSDKKMGETNWLEISETLVRKQEIHEKASWSQNKATIEIKTELPYIIFDPLADTHIGAIGCNYESLKAITMGIVNNPFIYTALIGDVTDNFVSFKNQLPVLTQLLSPDEQDDFVVSWLNTLLPKLLFSTWGNHEEFEERATGRNAIKKLLNRNAVYYNGIGVCILKLNGVEYKIAATHRTRFNSSFNKTHGLKQLARRDIPDADIYISAHTHDPSIEVTWERGLQQTFMVLDSFKENDGYAKRNFSYWTNRQSNCVVLNTRKKEVIPFKCLDEALYYVRYEEPKSNQK